MNKNQMNATKTLLCVFWNRVSCTMASPSDSKLHAEELLRLAMLRRERMEIKDE